MKLDKVQMDEQNRMLRIGGGLNKGRPFLRIDLWKVGYRLTWGEDKCKNQPGSSPEKFNA